MNDQPDQHHCAPDAASAAIDMIILPQQFPSLIPAQNMPEHVHPFNCIVRLGSLIAACEQYPHLSQYWHQRLQVHHG